MDHQHSANNEEGLARTVTRLIERAINKEPDAEDALVECIYHELRERARNLVGYNGRVEATALVNQAWAKIFRSGVSPKFPNRRAFFAYASRAMRNLLIDIQRGTHPPGESLDIAAEKQLVAEFQRAAQVDSLLELEDALQKLRSLNKRAADVVELRFFGGLKMGEIAEHLDVSKSTVEASWNLARVKLRRLLSTDSVLAGGDDNA